MHRNLQLPQTEQTLASEGCTTSLTSTKPALQQKHDVPNIASRIRWWQGSRQQHCSATSAKLSSELLLHVFMASCEIWHLGMLPGARVGVVHPENYQPTPKGTRAPNNHPPPPPPHPCRCFCTSVVVARGEGRRGAEALRGRFAPGLGTILVDGLRSEGLGGSGLADEGCAV